MLTALGACLAQCLINIMRACLGLSPDNSMLLEHKVMHAPGAVHVHVGMNGIANGH